MVQSPPTCLCFWTHHCTNHCQHIHSACLMSHHDGCLPGTPAGRARGPVRGLGGVGGSGCDPPLFLQILVPYATPTTACTPTVHVSHSMMMDACLAPLPGERAGQSGGWGVVGGQDHFSCRFWSLMPPRTQDEGAGTCLLSSELTILLVGTSHTPRHHKYQVSGDGDVRRVKVWPVWPVT